MSNLNSLLCLEPFKKFVVGGVGGGCKPILVLSFSSSLTIIIAVPASLVEKTFTSTFSRTFAIETNDRQNSLIILSFARRFKKFSIQQFHLKISSLKSTWVENGKGQYHAPARRQILSNWYEMLTFVNLYFFVSTTKQLQKVSSTLSQH